MPLKPKAKPKVQPRAGARTAAEAATVQQLDSIANIPAALLNRDSQDSTVNPYSTKKRPEESLFLDDDSDSEGHPVEPFIVDEDTELGDAPRPAAHVEIEDGGSSATEEGDNILAMDVEDEARDGEDDDDPVVQSYDIIINSKLNEMLHLFQYPVRNKFQPYTEHEGLLPYEARWKINSGLLEIDIPTNIEKNYDREKGMQWGEAVRKEKIERGMVFNGKRSELGSKRGPGPKRRRPGDDDEESDEDGSASVASGCLMDFEEAKKRGRVLKSQTLGAKIQPSDGTNYFIGVWRGDQLHLTKMHETVQLRPKFPHVDIAIEQERAGQKALRELNNPTPARPQEPRAVNLTVKPGENKFGEYSRGFSDLLSKDLRKEEDEHWRDLEWIDQDENEAWEMYENLFKQAPRELKSVMSKQEYLDWCSAPKLEPENPLKSTARSKTAVKKEKA